MYVNAHAHAAANNYALRFNHVIVLILTQCSAGVCRALRTYFPQGTQRSTRLSDSLETVVFNITLDVLNRQYDEYIRRILMRTMKEKFSTD